MQEARLFSLQVVQDILISQQIMTLVLRAIEIEADCILGAKAIVGVYDSDPAVNPDAKKYDDTFNQQDC